MADNPPKKIYTNKIENRVTFKIKTWSYLKLLKLEKLKILGSVKNKITEDGNDEHVPHLETTEVALVNCNIVNNDYQNDSRFLYTFVPNQLFGQLLDISPKNFIFLKTFNSDLSYIEIRFTDQNSKRLEIENKINIALSIN